MSTEHIEDIYPLSPMQQGILFHSLYDLDSGMYVVQVIYDLQGNLSVPIFDQAWQRVVERHSILRTSFLWEDLAEPMQVVHRHVRLPLEYQDWRGLSPAEQQERLEAYLKADRERGFELSDAPLMRLGIIEMAEKVYKLVWSLHHLLLDGWSKPILLKEVLAFYEASRRDQDLHLEPRRPFRDYIAWLQQQDLSKAEAFWRPALRGFAMPTPLGMDGTSSILPDKEEVYGHEQIHLSSAATAALQSFAREHKLTLNNLVQGAWALLLSRYSGENDVVFGSVVSGRPAVLAGVESMAGLFVNTLPMRVQASPEETVLSWLKKLHEKQIEMLQYEYSPLIRIHEWSEVPRSLSLFESILEFSSYPRDGLIRQQDGTLEIRRARSVERTNYPLTVIAEPGPELSIGIYYHGTRFERATITRMLSHFRTVLEGIVADPNQRLSELPLLTGAERYQLLVEWNGTAREYPKDKCVHELFEAQVERTPQAVAVVFEEAQLTYRELNRRANQLAHYLRGLGVGPEAPVGICVERSLEMVVGILGILKAGGAYVPLDPAYPQERLAFMLKDTRSPVLLTLRRLVERLPENRAEVVCLDADWDKIASASDENPASGATAESLAYIIYTSGSTGRPKGVAMAQRPLSNLLSWQLQNWALPSGATTTLQFASPSFDVSFQEIFSTWCSGGKLVLIAEDVRQDAEALLHFLTEKAIERLFLPFVALHQLAEAVDVCESVPASLREIITAGEQLRITPHIASLFSRMKNCTLCNQYGPSESHVVTAFTLIGSPDDWAALPPIGRPIANTQIYILDQHLQPVPIGVPGELYIGGEGLARGYLNRPELTAEKFIKNPFNTEAGARLYKTGDLARYLSHGNIEFLGRIDHQVKIRGYRIELGEIEAVLSSNSAVQEVAVIAREDIPGDKRLVAYVVPNQESAPSVSELRGFLKEKLPEYMVPSAFVMLEELLLTPNGKVDRRALPAPDQMRPELEEVYVAPRTAVEEVVAGIWAEVLGLEQVGIYDNFFELGGHSLLVTQVISRVQEGFQVRVPLRRLFESPTVAELAESIEQGTGSGVEIQAPCIVPMERVARRVQISAQGVLSSLGK